jgi:hypothetical protein
MKDGSDRRPGAAGWEQAISSPGRSSGWASLVGQALAIGLRAQTRMRRKNKEKGRGLFCRVGGFEPDGRRARGGMMAWMLAAGPRDHARGGSGPKALWPWNLNKLFWKQFFDALCK